MKRFKRTAKHAQVRPSQQVPLMSKPKMFKQVFGNRKMSSQDLMIVLSTVYAKVYVCTIEKRLYNFLILEGEQGRNLYCQKNKRHLGKVKVCQRTPRENMRASRTMYFRLINPKQNYVGTLTDSMFGTNQKQYLWTRTSLPPVKWRWVGWKCRGLGLFCCSMAWPVYYRKIHYQFFIVFECA